MTRTLGLTATLILSLLLVACGSSSSGGPDKPTASIRTASLAGNTLSLKDGNVTVELNAQGSVSPRDASLTYSWELIAKPKLSQAKLSLLNTVNTTFTADIPGEYVVSLIVNDGTINSEASRMTFTATSPYPVAVAEPVHNIALGTDRLGLDASFSTLPSGETGELTYVWTLISKPFESSSHITNSDQKLATLHLDFEGEYKLQLVVSFNGQTSKPAHVLVTISKGNLPPIAKAENITVVLGQNVILDASESADPEGEPLQYRWKWAHSPVDPKALPIPVLQGSNTASLRFTPEAVGTYSLSLFVFDGAKKSENTDITVTVKKNPDTTTNAAPIGNLVATGYYPSYSIGEQELGLRAEFNFIGYDPEGEALQIIEAELIEKPTGSTAALVNIGSWKPLGKKIQKLDAQGTYRVRMVISDGKNQITREANMQAKVGNVNGQPSTRGVDAQSNSVLVGDALVFDASSKDPNNDPLTFHWELTDKPDGSKATIEAVIEPESQEYRRAKVVTDVPGSYTARLIVSDDRGLYAKTYEEDTGLAKLDNTAPEIRTVVWARSWGRLKPGEDYFQILPCMSLLHRPIVIDSDGDEVFTTEELINKPEGGEFTSSPSEQDCPNTRGLVFNKPGQYVFRYYATDLIDDAPYYDFIVNVEPFENAKGVRLRSLNSDDVSLWRPMPYENIPPFANDFSTSIRPYEDDGFIRWSLVATDKNYTVENVKATHINGELTSLTPWFEGLVENQTINQGETLEFKTWVPAVTCIRNDDRAEGFHFSFNIKEIPNLTFVYETWRAARESTSSTWRECEPGELN